MARSTNEQHELNLDQVFKQLKALQIQKNTTIGSKEVSKALVLFKKSQDILSQAIALLEAENVKKDPHTQTPEYQNNVAKYPDAPYGRRMKTGIPKLPSGKSVGNPEAVAFHKAHPELFATASERVGSGFTTDGVGDGRSSPTGPNRGPDGQQVVPAAKPKKSTAKK